MDLHPPWILYDIREWNRYQNVQSWIVKREKTTYHWSYAWSNIYHYKGWPGNSLWTSGTQEKVSIFSIEVCEQKSFPRTFLRQWWFWHTNIISTNCLPVLPSKWEFISYYVNAKLFLTSFHYHCTNVIELIVMTFLN